MPRRRKSGDCRPQALTPAGRSYSPRPPSTPRATQSLGDRTLQQQSGNYQDQQLNAQRNQYPSPRPLQDQQLQQAPGVAAAAAAVARIEHNQAVRTSQVKALRWHQDQVDDLSQALHGDLSQNEADPKGQATQERPEAEENPEP